MTANDIVKDLESVIAWFTNHGSNTNTAVIDISQRAIDVIERQRAEIERLKTRYNDLLASETEQFQKGYNIGSNDAYKRVKSEAIREFAERLKAEIKSDLYGDDVMPRGTIDWLVRKMMEEEEQ